jgi:hypothetical protein
VRVCERSTCVVSARFDGEDLARAPAKMQSWVEWLQSDDYVCEAELAGTPEDCIDIFYAEEE